MKRKPKVLGILLLVSVMVMTAFVIPQRTAASTGVDAKIRKVIYKDNNLKCWYKIAFTNHTDKTVTQVKVKLTAELGETVVRKKVVEIQIAPGESVIQKVFFTRLVDRPEIDGTSAKVVETVYES